MGMAGDAPTRRRARWAGTGALKHHTALQAEPESLALLTVGWGSALPSPPAFSCESHMV